MAFRPTIKFRDPLEAEFLVHLWSLKIIACDPNPSEAALSRFIYERGEKRAAVALPAIALIDPHLPELRYAGPRISGRDADDAIVSVANDEGESFTIGASGRGAIVSIKLFFDGSEFRRRKIVAWLDFCFHSDVRGSPSPAS